MIMITVAKIMEAGPGQK